MSTNRTKIDWAYRQALKIQVLVHDHRADVGATRVDTRQIAAMLRRAYRRGRDLVIDPVFTDC